jgi:molybdenum cofactor cytidylyltransferase
VSTAGLILAAGESRRMGTPKALLMYQGETFLARLVRLFSACCSPVIVVTGHAADELRAAATGAAGFVFNPDYRSGQTGSMQCGLRAVPPGAEGVLFTLVDHPSVAEHTLGALLATPGASPVRVPRYRGERGHPIWFRSTLIPEFLALTPAQAARDVVRAHRFETEFLDLDDPGIVADIDHPAAYRNLAGEGA